MTRKKGDLVFGETIWTDWQLTFLLKLSETANVSESCRKAKISRMQAYRVRDEDPGFQMAWDEALQMATEALELEARRRAMQGVREGVYYLGKRTGSITRYSDTLLIFLLKAHKPEAYRDNHRIEHTGKDGKDLPASSTPVVVILPDNGRNDRD